MLAALVAAIALGFVAARALNRSSTHPQATRQATTGAFAVSYPASWQRTSIPNSLPVALTGGLALRHGPGVLALGTLSGAASGLLPAAGAPSPVVVTLGGLKVYRYVDWPTAGDRVYTLPTTAGTIAGGCLTGGSSGFANECDRVLATLRLQAGSLLPLGTSTSYASALSHIIGALNAVRASAGPRLRAARTAPAQASAAGQLAAAHRTAAAAVLRLDAGSAHTANAALARALQGLASAYGALANAAAHHNVAGYKRAAAAVGPVEQALTAAFAELAKVGYSVG